MLIRVPQGPNPCPTHSPVHNFNGDIADVLRTREAVSIVGRKCPLPPKTRWLYLTDTLTFMLSNKRKIADFLKMKLLNDSGVSESTISTVDEMAEYRTATSLPSIVSDLYIATQPFKQASLCFECEQSRLSDAIPIIRVFQKSIRRILRGKLLRNRESYEFLRQLTAHLLARLTVFLPPETWACWALTREGRYQLRKKSYWLCFHRHTLQLFQSCFEAQRSCVDNETANCSRFLAYRRVT